MPQQNVVQVGSANGNHAAQVAKVKGGKPAPKPAKGAKPAKGGAPVDPLAQLAQQQVSQAEMPIEQQIQAEKAANLAKAQAQMGFAKAAAAIMQQAAPAVQNAYTGAANSDAGYARALGNAVQAPVNQSVQQNNQFLQQMGAPSGALSNAAPVGDIAYGLQGYIPATSLQREGAAWESAAQMAPADQLAAGQQQATATLTGPDAALNSLNTDLAKIAATEPSVYNHLVNTANTQAYHNAEIGLGYGRLKQGQQRLALTAQRNAVLAAQGNARIQQGYQRLALDQQRLAITAQKAASSNAQAWARIGISQKNLRIRAAELEMKKRGGGYTATKLQELGKQAGGIAYTAFNGQTDSKGNPIKGKGPRTWKQAMQLMMLADIPPSIAIKQLHEAGYHPGDGRGTPMPLSKASYPGAPGMFSWLDKYAAGAAPKGSRRGGQGVIGAPQGVAANVGGYVGGKYAHSHNAGGFLPPGLGFEYNRHDQGRDIQTRPGAPIIAPGNGYVVRIASDPGGGGGHFGPSYPIVHFTSGPYAGQDVYIGHTVAAVRPGEHFRAGAVLSHTQNSGPMNGGAPSGWAEIGFAPGGTPGVNGQPAPF